MQNCLSIKESQDVKPMVVLRWLSGAGTSQEVFSLIWRHSTASPTSPAYITLR